MRKPRNFQTAHTIGYLQMLYEKYANGFGGKLKFE
jgi:hypothetical protein